MVVRGALPRKIAYGAFEEVAEKTGKDAVEAIRRGYEQHHAVLEVKAKRIGGATYQVPIEVKPERRQALALAGSLSIPVREARKTQVRDLQTRLWMQLTTQAHL